MSVNFFKSFLIFNFLISIIPSAYSQKVLILYDSVSINSTLGANCYLSDITYFEKDHSLSASFYQNQDSLSSIYQINRNHVALNYKIDSKILIAEKCDLFATDSGYYLPKYFSEGLIFFDNSTKQAKIVMGPTNFYYKDCKGKSHYKVSAILDPYYKAGGSMVGDRLLMSAYRVSYMDYSRRMSWVSKKLKAYYNQPFLMFFKIQSEMGSKPFGRYPQHLIDSFANFRPNMKYYFCPEEDSKRIFVSFGASPMIFVYNFSGNVIDSFPIKATHLNVAYLYIASPDKSVLRFPDYYRLGLDSYGELKYSGGKLYRVYRKALPLEAFQYMKPDLAYNICRSPAEGNNWSKAERSKTKVLQEINVQTKEHIEYNYPYTMDIFLGRNDQRNEYYFRKFEPDKLNTDRAVVYIYKPSFIK